MELFIILGILTGTYLIALARRMTSLIRSFRLQSFFLSVSVFLSATHQRHAELYLIAVLLFTLKVILIPRFLFRITEKIRVNENIGLFLNSQLSLLCALIFTYASWMFSLRLVARQEVLQVFALTSAFAVILAGLFIMIFRMKALTQTIGILIMENGIFLLASALAGGMPFLVEIALCLDIFVSVIILNVFVYRINKMFAHIDVNKLNTLKG